MYEKRELVRRYLGLLDADFWPEHPFPNYFYKLFDDIYRYTRKYAYTLLENEKIYREAVRNVDDAIKMRKTKFYKKLKRFLNRFQKNLKFYYKEYTSINSRIKFKRYEEVFEKAYEDSVTIGGRIKGFVRKHSEGLFGLSMLGIASIPIAALYVSPLLGIPMTEKLLLMLVLYSEAAIAISLNAYILKAYLSGRRKEI